MTDPVDAFLRWSELDRTTWPEFRDRIVAAERDARGAPAPPRSYPGYPTFALEDVKPRLLRGSLDRALRARRSVRRLKSRLPDREELSRLLGLSHGVSGDTGKGPVPSAGGLQALELYLVNLDESWLPRGAYHYDRAKHLLAQVAAGGTRDEWRARVPSLDHVEGGSFVVVLVGDQARVRAKYGPRGDRFLVLEAGHLMQNLCLVGATLGVGLVPLGGVFEREVARALVLPATDVVLYVGIGGAIAP